MSQEKVCVEFPLTKGEVKALQLIFSDWIEISTQDNETPNSIDFFTRMKKVADDAVFYFNEVIEK